MNGTLDDGSAKYVKVEPRHCRVAFSTNGRTLDGPISRSFASAPYFILVEGSPDMFTVIQNMGKGKGTEAGMTAAKALIGLKIDTVVTGNIGGKASGILEKAHVRIHAGCSGTVFEAISKCLSGRLVETKGASYSGCLESPGTAKARQ